MDTYEFYDAIRPAVILLGIGIGFYVVFNWGRKDKPDQ